STRTTSSAACSPGHRRGPPAYSQCCAPRWTIPGTAAWSHSAAAGEREGGRRESEKEVKERSLVPPCEHTALIMSPCLPCLVPPCEHTALMMSPCLPCPHSYLLLQALPLLLSLLQLRLQLPDLRDVTGGLGLRNIHLDCYNNNNK
ncbi:hypothetical protein SKAU_G00363180, partial [Synaphobranchus kaupii]